MTKIITSKAQLNEYIQRKKSKKIYESIMISLHENMKYLNENVSLKATNQNIIDDYKRKGLINSRVFELLKESNIVNDKYEII